MTDDFPTEPMTTADLVLTRERCAGPAPYVGQPFVYVWPVGVDNLGRCIAGEAQIVYTDPFWSIRGNDETAPTVSRS